MKIEIIRSRRKTIAIQIKPDLSVVVRAPYGISKREINEFIECKYDWIERIMSVTTILACIIEA